MASSGFGWSAGDVVSAAKLLKDLVQASRNGVKNSGTKIQNLNRETSKLHDTLQRFEQESEDLGYPQYPHQDDFLRCVEYLQHYLLSCEEVVGGNGLLKAYQNNGWASGEQDEERLLRDLDREIHSLNRWREEMNLRANDAMRTSIDPSATPTQRPSKSRNTYPDDSFYQSPNSAEMKTPRMSGAESRGGGSYEYDEYHTPQFASDLLYDDYPSKIPAEPEIRPRGLSRNQSSGYNYNAQSSSTVGSSRYSIMSPWSDTSSISTAPTASDMEPLKLPQSMMNALEELSITAGSTSRLISPSEAASGRRRPTTDAAQGKNIFETLLLLTGASTEIRFYPDVMIQQQGGSSANNMLAARKVHVIKIWRDADSGSMMSIRSYETERDSCKLQQIADSTTHATPYISPSSLANYTVFFLHNPRFRIDTPDRNVRADEVHRIASRSKYKIGYHFSSSEDWIAFQEAALNRKIQKCLIFEQIRFKDHESTKHTLSYDQVLRVVKNTRGEKIINFFGNGSKKGFFDIPLKAFERITRTQTEVKMDFSRTTRLDPITQQAAPLPTAYDDPSYSGSGQFGEPLKRAATASSRSRGSAGVWVTEGWKNLQVSFRSQDEADEFINLTRLA